MNQAVQSLQADPFLHFCRELAKAECHAFQDHKPERFHNVLCGLMKIVEATSWQSREIIIDSLMQASRAMDSAPSKELAVKEFLQAIEVCWRVLETTRRIASAIATGQTVEERLVERMASLVNPGLLTATRPAED